MIKQFIFNCIILMDDNIFRTETYFQIDSFTFAIILRMCSMLSLLMMREETI